MGYSLETAIADIIDNSIAAHSKLIETHWEWNDGEPVAWILDDGSGMGADRLVEAMRFGGIGPDAARPDEDLGRFGLGLKTASLSQCRQLTVASKTSAGLASFTWDIDELRNDDGGWNLIEGDVAISFEKASPFLAIPEIPGDVASFVDKFCWSTYLDNKSCLQFLDNGIDPFGSDVLRE